MPRIPLEDAGAFFNAFVPATVAPSIVRRLNATQLAWLRACVLFSDNVDLGRLRGGWDVSVGSLQTDESQLDPGGGATVNAAVAKIQTEGSISDRYVANPVEYARYQNDGTERVPAKMYLQRGAMVALDAWNNYTDTEIDG